MTAGIRPERITPDTGNRPDKSQVDAEVAHEQALRAYLDNTELGILTPEQMSIMALVDSCEDIGLYLPATRRFFEKQRRLSSGKEGVGRIQAKEVITAGSFPMSLLFPEQPSGIIQTLKNLWPGSKPAQQQPRG